MARVLWVQFGVLVFLLATVALSAYMAQSRNRAGGAAANQARYRSFIQMSSEAVWRVELEQPMPVSLPAAGTDRMAARACAGGREQCFVRKGGRRG